MKMNKKIFIEKYNEIISNNFIINFFITNKITCGLFFIENGNFEIRSSLDKPSFLDRLFNSCRLIRFFYLNNEETYIFKWVNYLNKLKADNKLNEGMINRISNLNKINQYYKKLEVGYLNKDKLFFWHGYKASKYLDEYYNGILFHNDEEKRKRLKTEQFRLGKKRDDFQIFQLIIVLKAFFKIILTTGDILLKLNVNKPKV